MLIDSEGDLSSTTQFTVNLMVALNELWISGRTIPVRPCLESSSRFGIPNMAVGARSMLEKLPWQQRTPKTVGLSVALLDCKTCAVLEKRLRR